MILHNTASFSSVREAPCRRGSADSCCHCAGERKPPTLPVQANGIASYFPSLAASSDALQQFNAPRPALRSRSNSPGIGTGTSSPVLAAAAAGPKQELACTSSFFGTKSHAQRSRHSCLGTTQLVGAEAMHEGGFLLGHLLVEGMATHET